MRRRMVQLASAILAATFVVALALPGSAAVKADELNAAINGDAVAYGAFVPIDVNPKAELYPAFTASRITAGESHGLAGGFYPGFLVDAAAQFYGYGAEARSTMGIAESLWPNEPHEHQAATTDFADKCRFMGSDFHMPPSFVSFCARNAGEYMPLFLPGHIGQGGTMSDELLSSGNGYVARLRLPENIEVGSVESTTLTTARDAKRVVSEAGAVVKDVRIGPLRIKEIRSRAYAVSTGRGSKAVATQELQVTDATLDGQPVVIDESGVHALDESAEDLNASLAQHGFRVHLITGATATSATRSAADAGGLVVLWSGDAEHRELKGPSRESCRAGNEAQGITEAQIKALTGKEELARVEASQPNPLMTPSPSNRVDEAIIDARERDGRPFGALPPSFDLDQPVPPLVPCAGFLLQRTVTSGVAFAGAVASARFQPIPAPPDFDFDDDFADDFGDFFDPGPVTSGGNGPAPEPPFVGQTEERPTVAMLVANPVGADVAKRLRLVYGAVVLAVALLVVGRSAFRGLVRI